MPIAPDAPFGSIPDLGQPPDGWRLDLRCRCKSSVWPVTLLIRRFGPDMTAPALLAKMRCSKCHERPTGAWVLILGTTRGGLTNCEERVPVLP